jgi:hypothetical protein
VRPASIPAHDFVIATRKFVRGGGGGRNPRVCPLADIRDGIRLAMEANMSFKQLIGTAIVALSIGGAAFIGGQPSATAQDVSYPWCTQGGALHCYYMNRQQCEETVDYHGFCVANPDYAAQGNGSRRHAPPQ